MTNPQKPHIENPCPMILARIQKEGDFYCKSCKKDIIDFREKSDKEIIEKSKDGVCGIYNEDQVTTTNYGFRKRFLFQLLTVLSFIGFNVKPIQAQETPKKTEPIKVAKDTLREPVIGKIKLDPKRDTLLMSDPDLEKPKKKWFRRKKKKVTGRTIGCPSF
jgi:hypothetical protein